MSTAMPWPSIRVENDQKREEELPVELKSVRMDDGYEREIHERHKQFQAIYDALPPCGSTAFWQTLEEPRAPLPLEVMVRCIRQAHMAGDDVGRNRIIEKIILRTQASNERWADIVLNSIYVEPDERQSFQHDLYADLCERMIRALLDVTRLFWEENFQHCLMFERKHAYHVFMTREGRRPNRAGTRSSRIPRPLISRLHQPAHSNGEALLDLEDERARRELLAVEHTDLPRLVLHLPNKLKAVILLIFWEGCTEKECAQLLSVTDRTIRNRLRQALKLLREALEPEKGSVHG
jgi:hypothetical protein